MDSVMKSVIQVVALRKSMFGNMQPGWTGSGTLVDPRGLVLTNCHVAYPQAMGMPVPEASVLGIAITQRSDQPPALTYLAEIAAYSPELDLAVLRIVANLDGSRVSNLNLPAIPLGDSDQLDLGDQLAIFGYPGIGGETITFTSGSVSGFNSEEGVGQRRAWIKTDATIAGGNSGGTAVDENGNLVGVPTQAAAGKNIMPVDARPVTDTNRDGRIDQYDSPIAIGGFINGLRPINLAKPLLQKAGAAAQSAPNPNFPIPTPNTSGSPSFNSVFFSTQVTPDSRPINPSSMLPSGLTQLFATFDYDNIPNGMPWSQTWALDGKVIYQNEGQWSDGTTGRKTLVLGNKNGLPDGMYHLVLMMNNQIALQGDVTVGRHQFDTDSQISGQVVDAATGQGIGNALVIALKPNVPVAMFAQTQSKDLAYTYARTDNGGRFTFPQQLPKSQAYGLVVVAQGYADLAVDGALRIGPDAPEQAQLSAIPLQRG
jgi:hypothetical protein